MSESLVTREKVRTQIQRRDEEHDLSRLIDSIESGKKYRKAVSDKIIRRVAGEFPERGSDGKYNLAELILWNKRASILQDKLKPERNAIIASVLPTIWKNIKKKWNETVVREASHEIYRDDKRVRQFNDAADFKDLVYNSFVPHLVSWRVQSETALRQLERDGVPKEKWPAPIRAFERFQTMLSLHRTHLGAPIDEAAFIARGVGTATFVTWSLIALVPKLAKEHKPPLTLTPQEILDIIRTGYGPLITVFSSMNIEVGPELIRGLADPIDARVGFDSKNFALLKDEKTEKYKLWFDHSALEKIVDDQGRKIIDRVPKSGTSWCPVRYTARGEVDVMRDFFEHCLSLAEKYYLPYR